jgi:hypothetical protein
MYDLFFRLVQYRKRTKGLKGVHQSLIDQLDLVEKQLVASQEIIEIRGKVSTVKTPTKTTSLLRPPI